MKEENNQVEYFQKELEESNGNNFRDTFYFLCQERKTIDIKKCFIKQKIVSKISEEVISFGLMGCARANKLDNAMTLLECGEKYKKMEFKNIFFSSAINLAIKKDHLEFAQYLIEKSHFLQEKTMCFINDNEEGFCSTNGEEPTYSVIAEKYNKYGGSSLEVFAHDRDKLTFVLEQSIDLNRIKNFIGDSIKNPNMTALLCIVKSQYLTMIVEDIDFKTFMNSDNEKNMKAEFQNLINNALLEKKLNKTLPEKNSSTHHNKI